jgi:hypothetical protein
MREPGNAREIGALNANHVALDSDLERPALPVAAMSGMLNAWPHLRARHRFPKRASMISTSTLRRTASTARGPGCRAALERASAARAVRHCRRRGQARVDRTAAGHVARLGHDSRDRVRLRGSCAGDDGGSWLRKIGWRFRPGGYATRTSSGTVKPALSAPWRSKRPKQLSGSAVSRSARRQHLQGSS